MNDQIIDFSSRLQELERMELEAGGISIPSEVYAQMLGIYLHQNDLCNAKFLWRRIPASCKTTEIENLWAIGQKLWQKEGVYEVAEKEWSEPLQPIIKAIINSKREHTVNLTAKAYSSISCADLAGKVGMPVDQAIQSAVGAGWEVDAHMQYVFPKPMDKIVGEGVSCEEQLFKLTDFVAFLEN